MAAVDQRCPVMWAEEGSWALHPMEEGEGHLEEEVVQRLELLVAVRQQAQEQEQRRQ